MHFHRDVLAICDTFPPHVVKAHARRRLHRQPAARLHLRPRRHPALFPLRIGASTLLLEKGAPNHLLPAMAKHGVSVCFTSTPTASWRRW